MGENIVNLLEKKEIYLGDAITARTNAMPHFIGLGPPDLVVLVRDYAPPKLLIPGIIKRSKESYFHWALGNDVSSGAAVAAYFGLLLENQEKHIFGRGIYTLEKCYYCCYNAFRKMDLRVEITVPERDKTHTGYAIEAYAVDALGNRHEIEENFWKESHISATLRLITGPPYLLRPIRVKDSLNNPVTESQFLALCTEYFNQARALGNPDNGYSLLGIDASNNLLSSTLYKYFERHNRFEQMIAFFDNFINVDPVVAVPMAYAEAMLDKPTRALSMLDNALARKSDSSSIMLAIAELGLLHLPMGLDRHLKLLDILKTALNAVVVQTNLPRGWWILAKCLIEMGRYEWALVVMNNAPVISADFSPAGLASMDRYGSPHFERFTTPLFPVNNISTILQDEEKSFADELGDASLRMLAAPGISNDERTVYNLLSDIISRSSWDHLTKMRSRALVRPADMVRAVTRRMRADSLRLDSAPKLEEPTHSPPAVSEQAPVESVASSTTESTAQKSDGKADAEAQLSTEVPPVTAEQMREEPDQADAEEKTTKEQVEDPVETIGDDLASVALTRSSGELSEPREAMETSEDVVSDIEVNISRRFSVPTFCITRDLDVDDALTQFLIAVVSARSGVSRTEVQTTPMNVEIASSPMIPVCDISRTLDVAFHAIFQDIKAFHSWKEEEKKLGWTSTDLPEGALSIRPVADWIRIASVCERLNFLKDAQRIYKLLEGHHIKALCAMVTYDAERGDIKSTLLDASSLLNNYSKYNVQQPHPIAVSALLKLLSSHGLHKVRSMESSLPNLNPLIQPILSDAVRWKSKGFDL